MKNKKRDSNYELLRIISMFMIVVWHIIVHGSLLTNTTGMINLILKFIEVILVVHVNSFILVTGYYQCKSEFKFKKLISINNAAWFYRIAICIMLILLNITTFSRVNIIRNFMPIDLGFYWFIDFYLLLYCISPFLNILIKKMDRKTFQKLLITAFVIMSIIPSFTGQQAFNNGTGYSLYNFIFLYFIGSYFRLYKIEIWEHFKVTSPKVKQIVYFGIFCFLLLFNFTLYNLGDKLLGLGNIAHELGSIITTATYSYDNPLVIIGAVMYFLWFGCLSFKSNFINKMSSLVFGVYLIHDNIYIRDILYQYFNFKDGLAIESYRVFPKILLVAAAIFISCLIIEWLRQIIFNLVSKMWVSRKIKDKWYRYLEELKSN